MSITKTHSVADSGGLSIVICGFANDGTRPAVNQRAKAVSLYA
jgi:hypothetical protein